MHLPAENDLDAGGRPGPLQAKGTAVEHVVFFPSSDGTAAFRRLASVEEAVRLVEHLRNVEGVESVSLHALTEVPLAFRAYYRVEVPVPQAWEASAQAAPPAPVPVEPVAPEPTVAEMIEPEPEPVPALALVEMPVQGGDPEQSVAAGNGHRDGPSSLGFFA
ncbi:MAG: hypothetical protein KY451_09250 [Actinobacteria bacterium]|nr:hypothetical protein [Actinomycetota bacterium]MBW3647052.1 hypothetical protein [Actinomycetota bacterium]